MDLKDRFLEYVRIDTQSDDNSQTTPSTRKQLVLADLLESQLKQLGLEAFQKQGTVYARLEGYGDPVGFIAHMDTATELSGKDVRPRIIPKYDGGTIQLNEQYSMDPARFAVLEKVIGDDLIVTDGTTLLGGDDKAGIAIIMSALEQIVKTGVPHRTLWIAFTPDEEIGRGTDHFDLDWFKPPYAYTVDGDNVDQVDYETFNAASARVNISGTSIHPGEAKGKMVNAGRIAAAIASQLPESMAPETTEGREGFFHLTHIEGTVDQARLEVIIRDHDKTSFEARKQWMDAMLHTFVLRWPGHVDYEIHDQYHNLHDFIQDPACIESARKAIEHIGLIPCSVPVRGGTDGAMLGEKGLPAPNLGTGSWNHHGRFEFASIQKMETMRDIVMQLMEEK